MYTLMCDEKDITQGQRFLLNLIEKRKLKQLCIERELSHVYTFNIGVGKNIPSAPLVYALRDFVHPVLWFYTESEASPELKQYEYVKQETWNYVTSLGFKQLHELIKPVTLRNWAIKNGFDYPSMWWISKGKRAPSYYKIKELRDKIYPGDWFYTK